ncbi:hypothetical protein MRB53_013383 [Persea americana]|uniref:Uncharacterized protein n=1 Tax=Persea americana TaxID=3435 RepID=A0ACC2K886_PERAE|nr:hypothetical protein MRB53_013383 [Persea americana]
MGVKGKQLKPGGLISKFREGYLKKEGAILLHSLNVDEQNPNPKTSYSNTRGEDEFLRSFPRSPQSSANRPIAIDVLHLVKVTASRSSYC